MTIPRRILLALLIGLGLARAGSYLVAALASLPSPLETFHLEAKMVLLADRARAGLDLYPEWRNYPHVANFFAPLYFSLVGLAGRWSGSDLDGLFAIGRWASFAAGLLTSAAVGWVGIRRYGRLAGLSGAVVSLGTAPTFGFSVMVRPDMLAEFLGVAGFFLAVGRSGRLRILGGAVLVAAALTKQTAVIYAAAASLAWIASGERRRGIFLGAGVGLALLAIVAAVTLGVSPRFAEGLTGESKTPWDPALWRRVAGRLLALSPDTIVLPLLGLGFWLRRSGPERARDPQLAALTLILILTSVATSAKRGADLNYYLGLRAAAGLAAAAIVRAWSDARGWRAGLGLSLLTLGAALLIVPGLVYADEASRGERAKAAFFRGFQGRQVVGLHRSLADRVARPDAAVLTDSGFLDIQRRDRAMFGDPWLFRMLTDTGRIDPRVLRGRIEARAFDLVITTSDIARPEYDDYEFGLPKTLADPVRAGYVRYDQFAGFFLYRRRPAPPAPAGPRGPAAGLTAPGSNL